ncbi:MAG: hypothetical protein V2I26_09250 [Halieaceae bacterium]|nr:hypothetical protein [Halieaceae bacterium]
MSWLRTVRERYRVNGDPLRTLRRIELVAVLLGLLLCLQLALGALHLVTLSAPDPVTPAPDSLRVPTVLSPVAVAASERNEIISRPLFWSSRRPLEEVAVLADPKNKAGELKGVKLVGLFGSGEQSGIIALVKGEKRRILLGDAIEGWTLKSVSPLQLVVANGERTETLALERGRVKAAPAGKNADVRNKNKSGEQARVGQVEAYPVPATAPAGTGPVVSPPAGTAKKSAPGGAAGAEPERTLGLGPGG